MGKDRLGEGGAIDCECDGGAAKAVDGAGVDDEYDVWLSTPSASDIDGSDWRVVCLASCSSPLVRRDSGGVRAPDCAPCHVFA